jgi:hypothetical protein
MSIVSYFRKPNLFVTFTCNPKWPEITRELLPHQNAVDRPDLTARIFYIKLQKLLKDLLQNNCLSKIIAYIYMIKAIKLYVGCSATHLSRRPRRPTSSVGATITRKAFRTPKGVIITGKAYRSPSRGAGYPSSVPTCSIHPFHNLLPKTRENKEKKGK